jgi:hypothetical protein
MRQIRAITLVSRVTGKALSIDGIVMTWFTRSPEEAIKQLVEVLSLKLRAG